MATFQYTAKRGLISGHVVDTVYTIEIDLSAHTPSDKIDSSQQFSYSSSETILHSINTHHRITTDLMTNIQMLEFREFLLSASSGESISFDLLGTIAAPNNVLTGILVAKKDYRPTRVGNMYYTYSFEIREQ